MSEEATLTLTETEVARLFRREALVSDAGLRIDAAERVERGVAGDDDVELERVQVHVRGDASEYRGARERHVAGRYERSTGGSDLFLVLTQNWQNLGDGLFDANRDFLILSRGVSVKLNYTYRL